MNQEEKMQRPWLIAMVLMLIVGCATIFVYFAGMMTVLTFRVVIVMELIVAIAIIIKYQFAKRAVTTPGRRIAR